ncbi:EamA family transporter [Chromobacterium sp. ATCC 53434]|uniref:DMT family transporter n=1 Tax=Chromobacterium sp. (strain ATCC 53434 / SC 14030) TaxID=2059672 RepID=UPI000C78FE65|nr:DMT family transporter [Chromobacterium sp. ATCC 53434]AUH50277.1 EamA family transporter [Chromobacterium sp. ATCC 53434]
MSKQHYDAKRYWLLILAATFLFGSTFPSSKIVLSEMPPLWAAVARFLVASAGIAPILLWQRLHRRHAASQRRPWGILILIGLLQTAGSMGFLNIGLRSTTPAKAAILMACTPLIVALMSRLALKEKIHPLAAVGLALAFFGVAMCIGLNKLDGFGAGDALVLCGAACWAASTLVVKSSRIAINVWVLTFWQMLIGSAFLALLAWAVGEAPALPHGDRALIAFLWLALPATTGAMALWFMALELGGAVRTSGFLFLSPLFATLISFAAFGYSLSLHELAGGVLIGIGIYLVSKRPDAAGRPHALPADGKA